MRSRCLISGLKQHPLDTHCNATVWLYEPLVNLGAEVEEEKQWGWFSSQVLYSLTAFSLPTKLSICDAPLLLSVVI